jgi:LysM repeat protein
MKLFVAGIFVGMVAVVSSPQADAQTFARTSDNGTATQLQALSKKIDEQNTKIDMLSQQILKLEQQLTNGRPGVMIGEATPAPPAAGPAGASEPAPRPGGANTHTVARGETLTSIAKMHNVSLGDLQKANHIENDRKLQIGQTIIIPTSSSSPSPTSD